MQTISDEQFESIVLVESPKIYAKFCKKELPIFLGLSILNALLVMFSHMLDPTVIATMSLGALLSVLLQGIYLWRFRSQVIVPFRLTYSLPRKLVSSYTLGLTYAAIFGLLQLLRIIPFVGALAPLGGAALIGFNTVVAYRYHRWQFMRQEANQSLHPVEWGVMLIVFGFFGFAVAIGIACMFTLGAALQCAVQGDCSIIEMIWDMITMPFRWLWGLIGIGDFT